MSEAICRMIIHHPDRLHVGITDGGTGKFEAAPCQLLAHRVRFSGFSRYFGKVTPGIPFRLPIHELPDECIEAAEFMLHCQKFLRVGHCSLYLETVTHDSCILQQRFYFIWVIT